MASVSTNRIIALVVFFIVTVVLAIFIALWMIREDAKAMFDNIGLPATTTKRFRRIQGPDGEDRLVLEDDPFINVQLRPYRTYDVTS